MPMPFNPAVMTNGGIALLTKAQAGECSIEFTRMVIGDGTYSADEETVAALQAHTALKQEKNSYAMSGVTVYTDNSVKLTALLTNQDPVTLEPLVTEGYYINEIGVYAKEKDGGDDTEVLYSIATTTGSEGDYMPPYNGSNPAEITQDYYCTVANSTDVTVDITGAALTVEQANEMKTEIENEIADIDNYEGRDVTVLFADEIAQYSDVWHWIKARINAGNFTGLRNCDYIPLSVDGVYYEEQMNINTYAGSCNPEIGDAIDFISRDCGTDGIRWNTTDFNNGNEENSCPYMVSNLKDYLDNTLYPKLPDALKDVITDKYMTLENRYSASGTLTDSTGWATYNMGPLWVPTETEVAGYIKMGTQIWSGGMDVQYPVFANSMKNRVKHAGANGARCYWWLACARGGSSGQACLVSALGRLGSNSASSEYQVPLCFRIAAD